MKDVELCKSFMLAMCAILFISSVSFGQVLNKPEPAPNLNIGATAPWTAACASEDFREFFVNFTWSPPLVATSNEFILELSDATGNFENPLELDRVTDRNTTFDFDFRFDIAEDIQGDGYKFRVRSTNPALTSPESDAFSMYFAGFTNPILISQDGNGTIPPGGVIENCNGGNITLTTHNVPNPENFNYNWFRSGTLLGEKSNSITVSRTGMYFVEIDYGPNCSGSANTLSNAIEIRSGVSSGIAIATSSNTTLCAGQTLDLVANINDPSWSYTWFKDGTAVTSPTLGDSSFTVDSSIADFEGDYTLQVQGSDICTEFTNTITINNAGNYDVALVNDTNIVLLPGQNRTLSATTTAIIPSYQWFKDGNPISGATTANLDISEEGIYFLRVTENGGACSGDMEDSENATVVLPADFEFVVDHTGSYVPCESTSTVLALSQIIAVTTNGTRTDVTAELTGDFSYQWTRNGAAINGATSTNISLASPDENGDYILEGILDAFRVNSNEINATLASGDTIGITSTDMALCDDITNVTLSADIDLSSENFTWSRDGIVISSTDQDLTVSETGTYELQVQRTGCPVRSNEITIIRFDESIVSVDADDTIVIVEGSSRTITASGASSYEWFNENNNSISSTATVTLTDEGSYLLIASVGNCTVSRTFSVAFRDNFAIPNVITSNGDGVNDLWILPNTFSNDPETTVIIYNENGEVILNQTNYQNNWPQSSTAFSERNMVFYYRIQKNGRTLNQGTITVIR